MQEPETTPTGLGLLTSLRAYSPLCSWASFGWDTKVPMLRTV